MKRFMGNPCDEILGNHSKGLLRRFDTLWVDRSLRQLLQSSRLSMIQLARHSHTDRHNQFQFLLHGTGRHPELLGDRQVAAAIQAAEAENGFLARAELTYP
jgi:hypothetical protein